MSHSKCEAQSSNSSIANKKREREKRKATLFVVVWIFYVPTLLKVFIRDENFLTEFSGSFSIGSFHLRTGII
jgi:hypothetical protein